MLSLFDKILKDREVRELFSPNDNILLALSGGPDSIFLLHFLLYIKERFGISISIAHFNHDLRGEESERDVSFVKEVAGRYGVPFIYEKKSVKNFAEENSLSIEEAARILRYNFLIFAAKKYNCNKIALAHTLDDLIETFFLKIVRGTGIFALEGIPISRIENGVNLIRPLLNTSKESILNYLQKYSIDYVVDSTNFSVEYTRNYIRHNIIPHFLKLNPNFYYTLHGLISEIKELNSYFSSEIDSLLDKLIVYRNHDFFKINLKFLLSLSPFLRGYVFKRVFEEFVGIFKDIYRAHIDTLLSIIETPGEKDYFLPNNINFKKTYDWIFLYRGNISLFKKYPSFCFYLAESEEIHLKDLGVYVRISSSYDRESFDIIYKLPYNNFKDIVIRNRRPGDRIGTKKLKKIFIDLKIPRYLRDKIPLIALKDQVLFIIGITTASNNSKEGMEIGVKFERGGILWNELWRRFLFQKRK